jgi:hypothetical protein
MFATAQELTMCLCLLSILRPKFTNISGSSAEHSQARASSSAVLPSISSQGVQRTAAPVLPHPLPQNEPSVHMTHKVVCMLIGASRIIFCSFRRDPSHRLWYQDVQAMSQSGNLRNTKVHLVVSGLKRKRVHSIRILCFLPLSTHNDEVRGREYICTVRSQNQCCVGEGSKEKHASVLGDRSASANRAHTQGK